MATSPAINTATWTCPICGTLVPIEYEGRTEPNSITFSVMSWADVRAHLWQHEGGA